MQPPVASDFDELSLPVPRSTPTLDPRIASDESERANVELLSSMMGGSLDPDAARKVLRRFHGDLQKAATALIEGDNTNDIDLDLDFPPPLTNPGPVHTDTTLHHVTPTHRVIDLTAEDDNDLSMAIKASMNQNVRDTGTHFGPSERAPNANWAMVPSNVWLSCS